MGFGWRTDAYSTMAASALATLTIFRYVVSGAAVMFTGPMFEAMGKLAVCPTTGLGSATATEGSASGAQTAAKEAAMSKS